ncbi:MAG: cation:H+ antiporter [Patiriisocius sp.]|jgi:cation:H+ antiporter
MTGLACILGNFACVQKKVLYNMHIMEWIQIGIWTLYLLFALFALVRGADMFVEGAKDIGASLGMSSFAIGVLIVGFGTSFPELASSVAAILQNSPELVVANAVGSNITNILLVVGFVVVMGGKIVIKRDLIKTELPIFFIASAHFILMIQDGVIDRLESVLLVATFAAYIWYLFGEAEHDDKVDLIKGAGRRPQLKANALAFLVMGLGAVLVGAHFSIQMVINIGTALTIPIELISIFAIALGTSLPELFVAIKSVRAGHGEMAIGSIFGSNAFNILMVVGIPGLFISLPATLVVTSVGVPILIAASAIFFVNGLARQIMRWEGMMMLIFFAFFLLKLIDFL